MNEIDYDYENDEFDEDDYDAEIDIALNQGPWELEDEDGDDLLPLPEATVVNAGGRIAIHPSENSDMLVPPPNMAFITNERAKELDAEQAKRARRR